MNRSRGELVVVETCTCKREEGEEETCTCKASLEVEEETCTYKLG